MAGLLSRLGFGTTAEEVPEILQGDSPALQGADLAVAYFSSRAGGDLHDFLRVSPQRFLFGLLDVARIVGLGPKSSLAVVSRGVVEAESKKMEFGLDGVKSILQAGPASAKDLSQRILQGVQNFMHMAPKHNDVTALTLTRGN